MWKRVAVGGVALGCATWLASAWRQPVARSEPTFDPAVVARLEVAGWKAYYARNPIGAVAVLARLARGQFAMSRGATLRATYYAVRGQAAYAGKRGNPATALRWMTRFYAITPRRAGVDADELAAAEIDYWVEHRRLVADEDKTALIDALARLHALLFGGVAEAMRASAEQRTLACNAVDRVTGRRSPDPARDWLLAEEHLRRGYELAVAAGSAASARIG